MNNEQTSKNIFMYRIIVQAKFKYSAFYKAFEKTNKNN